METKITETELIELLKEHKAAMPVTVELETECRMRKTNNPYFGRVLKRAIYNCFLNINYENSVNRQRVREMRPVGFKSQERTWGTHETNSIIQHGDVNYLQFKIQSNLSTKYVLKENGLEVNLNEIILFFPPQNSSSRQEVNKQIKIICPKIESIKSITINKVKYILI